MFKLAAFCLAVGALPSLDGERRIPLAPITLYTQFHAAPPAGILSAIQDELQGIMAPMGLRFEWRSLDGHRGEVSVELAVITFRGRCIAEPGASGDGPLGWTHMSDNVILPFAEVDCDRIRTFVGRELPFLAKADREQALGRAIGRVLAHELYHIFADTPRHGSWGVGKAAYTVTELLSNDFHFEDRESNALRESKAVHLLEVGSGPTF